MKKPVLLCILDGFGIDDKNSSHNAIAKAKMSNYNRILEKYPHSKLQTSGLDVGLPEGQIGNSEVGHMTIGAGRIIFQDLPRINNAIKDGSITKNRYLEHIIDDLRASKNTCHLMGLFSDGGVHSHIDHIIYLANFLTKIGIKVVLHPFLDGRDVAQKSALEYLKKAEHLKIATVCGRYYAMDRDQKWDRIKPVFDAIIEAEAPQFSSAKEAIEESYKNNITDEFIKPCIIGNYKGFEEGDVVIFCNFRADRARQLSECLLDENFDKFPARRPCVAHAISMTEYSEKYRSFYNTLFPSIEIKNSLPEILANHQLTQLRIAETEKYAHVTFFLSCGKEEEFEGETRILIQSPNVATYDLKPEMSAKEVGEKLKEAINSQKFDFIVVNYANCDMVGHSGLLEPSIKACQTIDEQLKMLEEVILQNDGLMLISADHGNVECMIDNNHLPHTSHTTNPVPFILIGNNISDLKLEDGRLSDIAPTILDLMQISKPLEMDGKSLIVKK